MSERLYFSLNTRFRTYIGGMLLLLLLLGLASYLSLQETMRIFEEVTEKELVELRKITALQDLTRSGAHSVYTYLATGDTRSQEEFSEHNVEVLETFNDILLTPSLSKLQREMNVSAMKEWQQALSVAHAIFEQPYPMPAKAAEQALGDYEQHLQNAVAILYEAYNARADSVEALRREAKERYRRTRIVTFSGFVTGFLIFLVATFALVRLILNPLEQIRTCVAKLGRGDLNQRISIRSKDEIGDLAKGINTMAARLKQDQETLEEMAIHDGLTGLYNRREFERLRSEELYRAQRYGHPMSLLMIDADDFKNINDSLGHQIGDKALRIIAAVIKDISRKGDIVARYGGEEFVVLLPETPSGDAAIMAERFRSNIASQMIDFGDGHTFRVSVSVGVATYPDDAISESALLETADKALYTAKRSGKNCVRRAGDAETPKRNVMPLPFKRDRT